MSSNRNRFNTSKKTKDWFPFAKYLFITDKHPVRQSDEKCSSSIEAPFSQQELEQIKGITNSLQCETRDAVRIALFEVVKDAEAAYEKTYDKAKAGSTVKGHEGRNQRKRLHLPKAEKDAVEQAATTLKISIKEFLRLAVIWLADGIKEESITRLTNSRRIGKDAVARQWSKENQGKPPSEQVAKLKEAQQDAQELIDYLKQLQRDGRYERSQNPYVVNQQLDAEEAEALLEQDSWADKLLQNEPELSDTEFLIRCKMREFGIDYELAKWWVEDDFQEFEMMAKMTSKERLEYLKKKHAPSEAELEASKRSREARIKHEKELQEYLARQEMLPKTWRGYVQQRRLEMRMIGRPNPYPNLPNPLPKDYPKPNDWDDSHVASERQLLDGETQDYD